MHTVKWNKKDWEILDISFSDKRKLHMLNSMCFIDNKINQENYYKLLEAVRDLAGYGDGTEKQKLLEEITMVEVDTLMQTILIEYLGLNVKKDQWELALYVWCCFFGWQDSLFPDEITAINYQATSPTLSKRIWFKGKKDIDAEVERILFENKNKSYSAGQALYYSMPFFCNAKIFSKQIYQTMLEEYQIIQDYKVPLAQSIDDVPVIRTRYFNIIRQELLNCQRRQMEMQNG